MKRILLLSLCALLSLPQLSFAFFDPYDALHSVYVEAAFGAAFDDTSNWDGNKDAVGRLNLGSVFFTSQTLQAGLEAGIESGAALHLLFTKEEVAPLGGVEIEATLKPMLDAALSLRTEPCAELPLFLTFKVGAVWRRLESDRPSVSGSREVSPLLAAGLGFRLYEQSALYLAYEWIGGQKPQLVVDEVNEVATIHHIPSRQALLLGFSYFF